MIYKSQFHCSCFREQKSEVWGERLGKEFRQRKGIEVWTLKDYTQLSVPHRNWAGLKKKSNFPQWISVFSLILFLLTVSWDKTISNKWRSISRRCKKERRQQTWQEMGILQPLSATGELPLPLGRTPLVLQIGFRAGPPFWNTEKYRGKWKYDLAQELCSNKLLDRMSYTIFQK